MAFLPWELINHLRAEPAVPFSHGPSADPDAQRQAGGKAQPNCAPCVGGPGLHSVFNIVSIGKVPSDARCWLKGRASTSFSPVWPVPVLPP